ncbi:MAG: hypothetical protein AAB440_00355 [Patescibacteria group bacterium]
MNGMYALVFGIITLFVAFVRAVRSLVVVIFMKARKSMKWFVSFGWLYRPVSLFGYVVFFIFLVFSFHILIAALVQTQSLAGALYTAFPFVIPAFGLYMWIGSKAS